MTHEKILLLVGIALLVWSWLKQDDKINAMQKTLAELERRTRP